jgi:hypothetical protein
MPHYQAGDRANTQARAEDFQLPVRALGYQVVLVNASKRGAPETQNALIEKGST